MTVVAFFTDPAAMDKVLNGLGSQDLPDDGSGSGSGSGSGKGSGSAGSAGFVGSGSSAMFGSGLSLGSNDPLNSFQNSALGGMMGMMGMVGGGSKGTDVGGAQGAAMIQSQYDMFQQILKVTVRKVKLYVKWQVLGRDRDMTVIAFFTDPAAMDKVLNGMGSVEVGAGSGSSTSTSTSTSTTKTGSGSGK